MKKVILACFLISTSFSLLFGQYKAKFGDYEFKSDLFGKTSEISIEGSRSIDVPHNGYAEVVFLSLSSSDKLGFGINGNLDFYEIAKVEKTENYYIVSATYLKDKIAKYKFRISSGCSDIYIHSGDDEFLLMLDSKHFYTDRFRTWVDLFKYLNEKY